MKLLLGILIGIGITVTGLAIASGEAQYIGGDKKYIGLQKVRDGQVICYIWQGSPNGFLHGESGLSCLVEPR